MNKQVQSGSQSQGAQHLRPSPRSLFLSSPCCWVQGNLPESKTLPASCSGSMASFANAFPLQLAAFPEGARPSWILLPNRGHCVQDPSRLRLTPPRAPTL